RRTHLSYDEDDQPSGYATPDEELDRTELKSDLDRALTTLPASLREAFIMKHVEGRSYEEMADLLGTTVGALKMRVHRAREALRSEEHTSELQSPDHLVCRLLLEKKKPPTCRHIVLQHLQRHVLSCVRFSRRGSHRVIHSFPTRRSSDLALTTLPASLREAFIMKHVEGRSYEEMADLLGTTVGALKMRVHRAREAL